MAIPRILVVDDDADFLEAVKLVLSNYGYEVVLVPSALTAKDMLEAGEDYEIILCDLVMPQMSGADFFKIVKATHPNIVFVIVSANLDEVLVRQLVRLGVDGIIAKPLDQSRLERAVESAKKRNEDKQIAALLKSVS